jgi:cytochrome c
VGNLPLAQRIRLPIYNVLITVLQLQRLSDMKQVLFALAATVLATAPAFADQALATSKNCMACHAVERKLVGPSYKDIASKYANDKAAVDKLAVKIIKGGSGVWGPVPMPANPQVNEADAKKLAAWVMAQK